MVYLPISPPPPWGVSLSACSLPCGGLAAPDVVGPSCDWTWLVRANYTRPSARSSSLGACAANSGIKAPPTAYVTALLTTILPLLAIFAGGAHAYFARAQAELMAELGAGADVRPRLAAAAFAVARGPRVPAPERRAWVVGLHLVEDCDWPGHAARAWALFALPPPLCCAAAALHLLQQAPAGAALGAGFAFALLALPLAGGGFLLAAVLRKRVVRALAHADTGRDPAAAAALTRWMGLDDGGAAFRDMVRPPAADEDGAGVRRAPRVLRSSSVSTAAGAAGGGGSGTAPLAGVGV
jgi:hypothetical protein